MESTQWIHETHKQLHALPCVDHPGRSSTQGTTLKAAEVVFRGSPVERWRKLGLMEATAKTAEEQRESKTAREAHFCERKVVDYLLPYCVYFILALVSHVIRPEPFRMAIVPESRFPTSHITWWRA